MERSKVVGSTELESVTSSVSRMRSNQLSYEPKSDIKSDAISQKTSQLTDSTENGLPCQGNTGVETACLAPVSRSFHTKANQPDISQSDSLSDTIRQPFVTEDGLILDWPDWHAYSRWRWTIQKGYARGYVDGKNAYFHRFITGAKPGQTVDHINGNPLDCRRCNLRVTDKNGNAQNRRISAKNRCGYKGVDQRPSGRWRAKIGTAGKVIHIGLFDTPEAAASAYDDAAIKYFGRMARLNFETEGAR